MFNRALVLVGCLGLLACGGGGGGGGGGPGSCAGQLYKSCTKNDSCLETFTAAAETIITACVGSDPTVVVNTSACTRSPSNGGCTIGIGTPVCLTTWDYGAASPANFQSVCTTMGGIYIPPP